MRESEMAEPAEFNPKYGAPVTLAPGLRRIVARNPSPMTERGTNTYLIGTREIAVIDPGPDDPAHLQAILAALMPDQRISHILVTHAHRDHSPLARALSRAVEAPVHAYGDAIAGRSAVMRQLADTGDIGGGEGVDAGFSPHHTLADGETVSNGDWRITAHWTPGHFGNHLAFEWEGLVFTGDLVMGWASSLVSPPDGDLTDFMASCGKLQKLDAKVFHPGHGAPVPDPAARLDWLIHHRRSREASILQVLEQGPATARQLAERIYTDTPAALMPAAERNVLAHLIDLYGKARARPLAPLSAAAAFALSPPG